MNKLSNKTNLNQTINDSQRGSMPIRKNDQKALTRFLPRSCQWDSTRPLLRPYQWVSTWSLERSHQWGRTGSLLQSSQWNAVVCVCNERG